MSITNIINNENVTLVQGVNGLFLCEESWTTSRRKKLPEEKTHSSFFVETETSKYKGETQTALQGQNEHADAKKPHRDIPDLIHTR